MEIRIDVLVGKFPKGKHRAIVRKAIMDKGRVQSKSVLSASGEWLPIQPGEKYPEHTEFEIII